MRKKSVFIFSILILAILFTGCAKPPDKERILAEKAFKNAMIGKDCDKEDYLAAEELLNQAREAINKKDYKSAKSLFLTAKKKSDAIVKYYRTHPDECSPKKVVKKEEPKQDNTMQEEDVTGTTKDPEMELPVIHFEFNKYDITQEDIPLVEKVAQWLQNFPDTSLRIEGNADERGSEDYNMSLGEKRAREVRDKLVELGIDKDRLKIISYGEEKPLNPAHNEKAWDENRRVEFEKIN